MLHFNNCHPTADAEGRCCTSMAVITRLTPRAAVVLQSSGARCDSEIGGKVCRRCSPALLSSSNAVKHDSNICDEREALASPPCRRHTITEVAAFRRRRMYCRCQRFNVGVECRVSDCLLKC